MISLIKNELKKQNAGKIIRLRLHKHSSRKHYTFLLEYINPKTKKSQKYSISGLTLDLGCDDIKDENFLCALEVRAMKEEQYNRNSDNFDLKAEYNPNDDAPVIVPKINLYDQMEEFYNQHFHNSPESRKSHIQNISKLRDFLGETPSSYKQITRDKMEGFRCYLLDRYPDRGGY